jgi:hypothetical protein
MPADRLTDERFVVCLPTYDERENLARMIDALEAALAEASLRRCPGTCS